MGFILWIIFQLIFVPEYFLVYAFQINISSMK